MKQLKQNQIITMKEIIYFWFLFHLYNGINIPDWKSSITSWLGDLGLIV